MSTDSILVEEIAGVVKITLNRPDKSNAFDDPMTMGLLDTLEDAKAARCVVITGAGKNFCAGQDLTAILARYQSTKSVGLREHLTNGYNRIMMRLATLECPVIAAVNGAAAGAGFGLACACDLRYGGASAKFRTAFIGIGLAPDSGISARLPQLIGYGRALEMALTNQLLDSAAALQYGLLNQVFPDADLVPRTMEIAAKLAAGPTRGMALTKRAFLHAASASFENVLAFEAELQELAGQTADHREGVKAFLEKRPPQYKGE